MRVHEEKIRAIREWPEPRNVTELRGFIGICTYYRKFVKGFSQLAAPDRFDEEGGIQLVGHNAASL